MRIVALNSTMLSALALAAAGAWMTGGAQAAQWLGATGDFNLGANWVGGVVPGTGNTATFTNDPGAFTNVDITLQSDIALLEFNSGALAYTLTTNTGLAIGIVNVTNNSAVEQTLVAQPSGGFVITGTINGPVALTAGPVDSTVLLGANVSALDTRFISQDGFLTMVGANGTVSMGSIEGIGTIRTLSAGTLTVGSLNSDTLFSGVIESDLSLTKVGTGTLELSGVNSYSGSTTVDAGVLIVNGTVTAPTTVHAGGTLGGTGTLAGATIDAGGVHAPGNSIGVQTFNGAYANHGLLRIEASPVAADQIVVNGTVDITGAALDLVLSPATIASWNPVNGPFTIIANDNADAVTGTFALVARNLLFLDGVLDYGGGDGNDVDLTLTRNTIDFAAIGATRNQKATATGIDSLGAGNPLWNAISVASDADLVRASFEALSGEMHASLRGVLMQDSGVVRTAMTDRLRSGFSGVAGASAPVLAYGPGGVQLDDPDTGDTVVWGQAAGGWRQASGDGNAAGIETRMGGLLGGADAMVGDWRLGLLAGYTHSGFTVDDRLSSGDTDSYQLGLYGGTQWGQLALRTGLAYSRHAVSTSRTVPLLGETLAAHYGAGTIQAFGELGYTFELGDATSLEPYGNLAYARLDTEGFSESGGAAALSSPGGTQDAAFTTIGLRASTKMAWGETLATLRGAAGWRHAFADDPTSINAFAGGPGFTITGAPITQDSAVVEAGLDLNLSATASLGIAYNGQFGDDAQDHAIHAHLAVGF